MTSKRRIIIWAVEIQFFLAAHPVGLIVWAEAGGPAFLYGLEHHSPRNVHAHEEIASPFPSLPFLARPVDFAKEALFLHVFALGTE